MNTQKMAWAILKANPNLGMFEAILKAYAEKTRPSQALADAYQRMLLVIAKTTPPRLMKNSPLLNFEARNTNAVCIQAMQEADV